MKTNILKYFITALAIIFLCSACSQSKISPEDKLIDAYEKYINDIIAEYQKTDDGDMDAFNNIGKIAERGSDIRTSLKETVLNEAQRERLGKIEEKRINFFSNR